MINTILNGSTGIKIAAGTVILIFVLLVLVIIIAMVMKKKRNSPGLSDKLPLGPMIFMTDDEAVLYDRIRTALRYFDGFAIYPKVGTNSILAARQNIHPKIIKKLEREFISDSHDFVIVNRARKPIAVIELNSDPADLREQQAYNSGLPVIRVDDPYVDPDQLANRIRPLMK
jgi:hypothetical protein